MIPIGTAIRATVTDSRRFDMKMTDSHVDQLRRRDHSNGIDLHGLII